jgi:glutathionylspermidine synthase
MRRIRCAPRHGWQDKVEKLGLAWHSGAEPYWNESAFYEFTAKEVEVLETATNELEGMCLQAAQHIIDEKLYARMGIPPMAVPLIEGSWEAEPPSLYGRFDFAYDGAGPPKLLEYNADTPTSLLEAAVAQWYWLQEVYPKRDQFNSIHERLLALWQELIPYIPGRHVDFCSIDDVEDGVTVTYLEDTARQAGLETSAFPINEIGWDGTSFVGPEDKPLRAVFKLYPWEWMIHEEFGQYLARPSGPMWIEPPWKMLLSNKGILPVLWDLFPRHQNLLESHFDNPGLMISYVRKPLLSREGANITVHTPEREIQTGGDYGEEGYIYQELAARKPFDDVYPVLGSWVIGHEEGDAAAGMGVRESKDWVTTNLSQFVPHLFD